MFSTLGLRGEPMAGARRETVPSSHRWPRRESRYLFAHLRAVERAQEDPGLPNSARQRPPAPTPDRGRALVANGARACPT